MNIQIKNAIGVALVVLVLASAYASLSYVRTFARSIDPSTVRSFSVSGEGKVVAIPDIAQFSFSIVTEGNLDLAVLQGENTESANKAINFLKSKGVEKKDIKTSQYSVNPRYQNYNCSRPVVFGVESTPCPPPEIVGYTVRQSVEVKIRDFEIIGDTLSGVVTNGANTVSQLSFTLDDPEVVRREARDKAIVEAEAKAKAMARAAGFSIGEILSINEGGFTPQFARMESLGFDGAIASMAPSPKIEAGTQDVVANVTIIYEIR
jgi:uncharacterized protein